MKRAIEANLLAWKNDPKPIPIILRGARQVGKTYLIEQFGQANFDNLVTINFELQPEYIACFNTLDPFQITQAIRLISNQEIIPGSTLLFLDEIQECPNAIRALRYFKEKMQNLHVISAGSLLEFILEDATFQMPVGRIQFLHLYPLSFNEYLHANDQKQLIHYLADITLATKIPEPVHQRLLKLVHEYCILGGMPAVIEAYLEKKDLKYCQQLQTNLLNVYRRDFGKYATRTDHKYLQQLFIKAPYLVGQNFKYVKVDPESKARDIKNALEKLCYAGLITQIFSTTAAGLPLNSVINEKKFKLLFLDVGLVKRATQLDIEMLMEADLLLLNRGIFAEQFVGQELLAYNDPATEKELFFWSRDAQGSQAEVDYINHIDSQIIPIEVKAGKTGRLKSLNLLMKERNLKLGLQVSERPLELDKNILSLPLYLIAQIPKLVGEYFRSDIQAIK
jgi:predicted AAA+ superfamily ATPase